jgi:hypothetical protein
MVSDIDKVGLCNLSACIESVKEEADKNKGQSIGRPYNQGCQIYLDPKYQNGKNAYQIKTKLPIGPKIYQMALINSKWT